MGWVVLQGFFSANLTRPFVFPVFLSVAPVQGGRIGVSGVLRQNTFPFFLFCGPRSVVILQGSFSESLTRRFVFPFVFSPFPPFLFFERGVV